MPNWRPTGIYAAAAPPTAPRRTGTAAPFGLDDRDCRAGSQAPLSTPHGGSATQPVETPATKVQPCVARFGPASGGTVPVTTASDANSTSGLPLPDGLGLRMSPADGSPEYASVASTPKTFMVVVAGVVFAAILYAALVIADAPESSIVLVAVLPFAVGSLIVAAALPTWQVTVLRVSPPSCGSSNPGDRHVSVTVFRKPCESCREEFNFRARDVVRIAVVGPPQHTRRAGCDPPRIVMIVAVPDAPMVLLDDGRRSAESHDEQVTRWAHFFQCPSQPRPREGAISV